MILILTDINDVHADSVIQHLNESKINYVRLNQDVDSLMKTRVSFDLSLWSIETESIFFKTNQIKCVWMRKPFVQISLEKELDNSVDFKIWKGEWNKTLQGIYSSIEHVPWLTPFRQVFRAENKYYQYELAKNIGFYIPPTLVSNIKSDLLKFTKKYKQVALKLMHQDVYKMEDGNYNGLYVNIISTEDINTFSDINENPIVLQKYIDKEYEVRYTTVGSKHFVARIDSQSSQISSVDWRRYDIKSTPYLEIDPPSEIRDKVNRLLSMLGLVYGAIDFIVDTEGNWIFLEINPLGQYLWVEDLTGLPISEAIALWLHQMSN